MATLHKVGGQILKAPTLLKDAYIRSGERELSRLSDAALEKFYENQRKMEEQRQKEREKQAFYERLRLSQLNLQQQSNQKHTLNKMGNSKPSIH